MRLQSNQSLLIIAGSIFVLLLVGLFFGLPGVISLATAEESSDDSDISDYPDFRHVTIYDSGEKLTVKTDAPTVAEVLSRAKILVSATDTVEPSLDSAINADNFFINIYRSRPAVVIDGLASRYLMTSSYDPKTIATEAGLTIYDGDSVQPLLNAQFLEFGAASVFEVIRGEGATLTLTEKIPFTEISEKDFSLGSGKSSVVQLGEDGEKTLVYKVKTKNGFEVSRELVSETITREPVTRIVKIGADPIEMHPLTASMGRNRYTVTRPDGSIIERQETYYDLPMGLVMRYRLRDGCGDGTYSVRADGVKVDHEGYVLVAANLDRYPLCSVVSTSLGPGKVYDTGTFATTNPEQFDLATDWTNPNGV
ncbi:G5 domain-containing protein [Candidatus Saccharibacteria bacterium]|nr:G5 domain-containing protein [Candidatus Saccharibacteria bacterium]